MRVLVAVSVAFVALAGCSGGGPHDAYAANGIDLEATPTTGVVRGVVVDEAIVPVPGAAVSLLREERVPKFAETDADGLFGFDGVEPGVYPIQVEKPGFRPARVNVEIAAGEDRPPVVRVLLEHIPGFDPFYDLYQKDGFIQCNTSMANACGMVNTYPDLLLGTGDLIDDHSMLVWNGFTDVGKHPDHTQAETVWDSTQALGERLLVRYETGDPERELSIACVLGTVESASPQVFKIHAVAAADAGLGAPDHASPGGKGCDAERAYGLVMEFFSGDTLDTGPTVPLGATVEQETTTFVAAFYDYTPPASWTFVERGQVPLPPA